VIGIHVIDPADGLPRAGEISTDRVRLAPLLPADAEALFPVLDDERLHAFTGGRPDTFEELRARLRAWSSERSPDGRQAWLNWLVRATDDSRILGTTQATVERTPDGLVATLAWTTASAEQGRGVASEAARAMFRWLIEAGVGSIEAHIHPEHVASASVARRVGLAATDEQVDGETVWRRSVE
jgi:RimJ/RimL family protein N-acetyltransferase